MTASKRKVLEGEVVSNKMDKTIVVKVIRKIRHPKYQKLVEKWKRYHVHDEKQQTKIGQRVEIQECRPLSKLKRFRLLKVL